jgi:hypothetical protein
VTVISNPYREMIENFLWPRLEEFDDLEDVWFQQDRATAHAARSSLGILREMSPYEAIALTLAITQFDPLRFFPVGIPQCRGL